MTAANADRVTKGNGSAAVKPEPTETGVKPEPKETEGVKTEPMATGEVKPEPSETEGSRPQPAETDEGKSELAAASKADTTASGTEAAEGADEVQAGMADGADSDDKAKAS